ncbi:GDSL esterase/lipase EXL3, partial [Bienertia sinuspersici]
MKIFSITRNNLINVVANLIVINSYLNLQINGNTVDKGKIPTFIVFGDSTVDTGNNNYVATIGKANFPPYGRDFPGGVPTGRYSNGKNALSLEDQLALFKEYINKLKAAVGENTTSTIISESLYLISSGSNDITNNYFASPTAQLQYNISTYTGLMVNWASSFVQKLYDLGARRIGVISAPPCGCLPIQRTLRGGLLRTCAEKVNQASILFNDKLFSELSSLNKTLSGSRIVYLEIYNLLLNLINNPSQSGFEVTKNGCCGTGNLEVGFLCNKLSPTTCKNASQYLFWDSFHPTEATYKVLVHE